VPGPRPWRQSHVEPKLFVLRKCVEPKLFAGEKVLGAEALRVQSGSEPKLLALQTWEEPKFNPFSIVSVKSLLPAEAGGVVSGPKALTGSSVETRTSSGLRRASSPGSDLIRPTWSRGSKYR
jgi:hypothetical protein